VKIVKASAKILTPYGLSTADFGALALRHVEWCGRVSHRSEDAPASTERFLETVVLGHGDWSITEHASVSVDATVDRGITHEWVRHRLFSFTQESTRFVNYEKKMPPSFIYPRLGIECSQCLNGDEPVFHKDAWWHGVDKCAYAPEWLTSIDAAETGYKALLRAKWRPQEARSVLPNALASRIVTTGNLRNWRHFFLSRTTVEAHPQIREVASTLLLEFQRAIPVLYADITPGARQIDNFRKAK
jgi:thymidylate synthase (FAD)